MLPFRNVKRFMQKTIKQPVYAFEVGMKRAGAYLSYYFGRGRSSAPEAITFFLTRLCNLRCKMCGQWGDYGVARTEDSERLKNGLSFDEIRGVLDNAHYFKPNITLFGGEPLMHPDVMDIIRHVKRLKLHCLIITNGTMLVNVAQDLVETGLDELNISIDGDRDLHDEIRGVAGMFDKIMAGIHEVNTLKRQKSKIKPLINIQCTISKYNYDRLQVLLGVAGRAQADSLTFHNLIFLKQGLIEKQKAFDEKLACSSADWEGFIFEPDIDPQKLYGTMRKILSQKHDFAIDFYPNFSRKTLKEYYENPDYLPSQYTPKCVSPWICAYVFPEGDVRPCLNCTYSYGNIKEQKFTAIWNSERAIKYRQTLKKEGIFPVCRRCTELYRY